MRCDIIIPVWNLKEYTQQAVESIIKNTDYPYRLIIIDNGSEKETKEYLESLKNDIRLPGYILIRNEQNQGYTIATNQGMDASDAPYVCLHNNDTIVCKGWLREMINVAESAKEIGIVNPNSNNLGSRKPYWMSLEKYAEKLLKEYAGKYIEMATAIGFCYLIKREVIDKIGTLKVGYGLGNFEDTEYCIRAFRNGYKSVFARGAYVWHAENASFDLVKEYEEMFSKNQEMFYEMFGKPRRILYLLTRKDDDYFKRLQKRTYIMAQKCNWVWVISKKKIGKVPLNVHTNIVRFRYYSPFFRTRCIFRIMVKKKKFDSIFTDDRILFFLLNLLAKFHKGMVREMRQYPYFDDSDFLRINLGSGKRACYGYINIDEKISNKKVIKAPFTNLPFEDQTVKKILLDCNAVFNKKTAEINSILKELERIAVPGCILSIDNFDYCIENILQKYNFIPLSQGYDKLFSVKSFICKSNEVKDDIAGFIKNLRQDIDKNGDLKYKVINEKIYSANGEKVNFFDKASLAQIADENGAYINLLEKNADSLEITLAKKPPSPYWGEGKGEGEVKAKIAVPQKKRICAIGQYMLLRYNQLGFDWDAWPRAFEKLGMDYLLLEGLRNINHKGMQDAILSFKPDYLLVVLKDDLPLIKDIADKLHSKGTKIIYWFCDPEHPRREDFSNIIDVMFLTNRGQIEEYKNAYNIKKVYYMPQGYDPYIQHRLNMPEAWDIGFSGAISKEPLHKSRAELMKVLQNKYNVKISNTIRNNIAEFYAQSKMVFGVSDFDFELYTSNRFYVALGCGAAYITKKFQGIELLGENKKHLLWFETVQELLDILAYYIPRDSERKKIRENAEKLALDKHTYLHRVQNIIDILDGKTEKFYGFL